MFTRRYESVVRRVVSEASRRSGGYSGRIQFRPQLETLESRTLLHAGDIDPMFGSFVTEFQGTLGAVGSAAALQSDGKIVVAGSGRNGSNSDHLLLARYNPDGTLDGSFGTGGKVVGEFLVTRTYGSATPQVAGVALQADGKIVAIGTTAAISNYSPEHFVVFRYNANGSPDTTFGSGGNAVTDFGCSSAAAGVAIQADGKILVVGGADSRTIGNACPVVLARYQINGSLDPAFGAGGKVMWGRSESAGSGVALQVDGKIVVGVSGSAAGLARFNPDGSPDSSFGTGGGIAFALGTWVNGLALQQDGKIVVATSLVILGRSSSSVRRYNNNGLTDTSFTWSERRFSPGDLALQADGRLLVLSNYTAFLGRYNSDGTPDVGFGTGGVVDFTSQDVGAARLALQLDGKIVVVGSSQTSSAGLRFNANGSIDTSFGTNGKIITGFVGRLSSAASAVAVQPDGKVVVAGASAAGLALARYNANGSLDATFGTSGQVTTEFTPIGDVYQFLDRIQVSLAVQADGRILVGGGRLMRYNADGSLDDSFATHGVFQMAGSAFALQADGKIVIAVVGGGLDCLRGCLSRLNTDGSTDNSFGTGGRVSGIYTKRLAIQADGRIVVLDPTGSIARFNANGSPDQSFGSGGRVSLPLTTGTPSDVALQVDGNIVTVWPLRRFQPDGSPDVNFGLNGVVSTSLLWGRVAVRGDGRIIVVSQHTARLYKPNGNPDLNFGNSGDVTSPYVPYGITSQPDGKIVIVGFAQSDVGHYAFTVTRYLADGDPILSPNQLFVSQVYLDLLHRSVEPLGLAAWTNLLDHGTSRTEVVQRIEQSQEYRTDVVRDLYQRFLRRGTDPPGLSAWVDFLGRGGTAEQVQALIIGSDEYFSQHGGTVNGYLQALYSDVLHRSLDPTGSEAWTQALAHGASRSTVATSVLASPESDRLEVQSLYRQFLLREPETGGLDVFTNALQRGAPNELILAIIVASDEYLSRL